MEFGSIGAELVDQQPQITSLPENPAPPQLEVNKSRWRQFLEQAKTDPNARAALMQVGLGLMRSRQPGQSKGDVVANAIQGGLQTKMGLDQQTKQMAFQQSKEQADQTYRQQSLGLQGRQVDVAEKGQAAVEARYKEQNENQRAQHTDRAAIERDQLAETRRHNQAMEQLGGVRANAYSQQVKGAGSKAAAQNDLIASYATDLRMLHPEQYPTAEAAHAAAVERLKPLPGKSKAQWIADYIKERAGNMTLLGETVDVQAVQAEANQIADQAYGLGPRGPQGGAANPPPTGTPTPAPGEVTRKATDGSTWVLRNGTWQKQ